MRSIKFTYWLDGALYIGFLNEYPDYQTQGESKDELTENLRDLLLDLESGQIPYVHQDANQIKRQKSKGKNQNECRFAFLRKAAARRSFLLHFNFCLLPFALP